MTLLAGHCPQVLEPLSWLLVSAPDLVPKYMVTVGTRWYLLGLAAAPLYQRVPSSPNSHKHNQDSNSLGGTTFPQATGLKFPVACVKSGTKSCHPVWQAEDKAAA
ncbi:MAG: hypothetical protein U1E29_05660, partial [Coriobacteriia bacterium]|nr:hypothetical protein [Coriobacteriia bacterium]